MNLFELFAKISLDTSEYDRGLDDASNKTTSLSGKLKSGLATAGKKAAAGIGTAATALAALGKQSIANYAEYEQLTGGIETLFGSGFATIEEYAASVGKSVSEVEHEFAAMQNRQKDVMDNAANAYKTAGMSANDYMSTVTSFSASLIQSLGDAQWQAAGYADMAITDMADNANKMGTSMDSIQNAYQGFAKQNFTMLDNLKLGYGGTKEEMERLMRDAEQYAGLIEGSLSIDSFADVVDAIHIVQDELGITGTTAKEAGGTIQGSFSAMKAAWDNLITGMSDPEQNLGELLGNMIDSVVTVGENLIPRIAEMLPRLVEGVTQLVQSLIPQLPGIIEMLLPVLITGATAILTSLLTELLPQVFDMGMRLLSEIATGIETELPNFIARLPQVIEGILNFITERLPDILEQGVEIIIALANGILNAIPELVRALPKVISAFIDFINQNAPKIITVGIGLIVSLAKGVLSALPDLVKTAPQLIRGLSDALKSGLNAFSNIGKNIVEGLWNGIKNMGSWIKQKVSDFFGGIVSSAKKKLEISSPSKVFAGIGGFMAEGVGEGWDNEYTAVKRQIERGLNFGRGVANIDAAYSGHMVNTGVAAQSAAADTPITIVVQSVLDGKVIGEAAYQYSRNKQRAYGVV